MHSNMDYFRIFSVHEIVHSLGEDVCDGLPLFLPLMGCDATSTFHQIGKKMVWLTWKAMPHMTVVFSSISARNLSAEDFKRLMHFVVVMYSQPSPHTDVNKARHTLFAAGRAIENIPPTEAALEQHVRRAMLQCTI